MDRMLYVSMDGARQTLLAQAANSNNLANVNTTGFQADLTAARAWPVLGAGHESRVHTVLEGKAFDATPGPIAATGRDLDVAINGNGWMAVQSFLGDEAYSRAGDLSISSGGLLVNGKGQQVLGDDGPIAIPPADAIEISKNGTVSVMPAGGGAQDMVTVGRIKLVKPDPRSMEKGPDGLLRIKDNARAPADASVRLAPKSLEKSNVNTVESLVSMIELSRMFETQIRMMRVADENAAATSALLRLRG